MTDLEKANEQLKTAIDAYETLNHAAVHDRKLSKDGHMNGHYVKALQELEKVKKHAEDMLYRIKARTAE